MIKKESSLKNEKLHQHWQNLNVIIKEKQLFLKQNLSLIDLSNEADIPVDHAKVLSINLQRECMLSHLLKIGSDGGGSMGYSWSYWIYGLFKFEAEEYYMLPLREFSSENEAREYVDGLDS